MTTALAYSTEEDLAVSARPSLGGSSTSVLLDFEARLRTMQVRSSGPSERQRRYQALAAKIRAWQREPVDFDPKAWDSLRKELETSTVSFAIPE